MLHDLRFGLRMLRRNAAFSFLAVLCLALGIGATTTVFSWIEGILLRPFPAIVNQDRMVAVAGTSRSGRTSVSWLDFQDFARNCTLADAFIAEHLFGTTLSIGDHAERATGSVVSANYFRALGIRPILGRGFDPDEDTGRKAHPVTVISYEAWKNRYRGDRAIVGRTQLLNGVSHTIIGVAPEGFYGTFVGYSFQFWVPASMEEVFQGGDYKLENRGARWVEGFALLKPGVSIAQAQAELSAIARRLEDAYPVTNRGFGVQLYPLWQTPFNGAGTLLPTLRISLVVACCVLLIACANVGNLLLVRSFARRHEMTLRLAVGAGRARLLRQLLIEGLLLSALAAAGGIVMAFWCRNLLMLFFPVRPGVVINLPAEIDWRVLLLSAGICLVSTLIFGLVPAAQAGNIDLAGAMRSESGSVIGSRRKAWIRSSLVVAQVSLSFILLVGAGLLLRSLATMRHANPGFSTEGVLTTSVDMVAAGYDTQRIKNFQDELINRIQGLGGVESATWARFTPFSNRSYASAPITVEGYETTPGEQPTVDYNEVGPSYFATMGIPLVSGREFARADNETARPVAVVNETMAARFWAGSDPVGKRLQVNARWVQVVGVARTSKLRSLAEAPAPFFYMPMRQGSAGQGLEIRTALPPETMANAIARELKALDASLAPGEVITMREQVDRMTWSQRAAVTLLAIFSAIALLLATTGLYGVLSYAVSQSTRELGLRMALGAGVPDVLRLLISHTAVLTAGGVVLGSGAALLLTRLMADMLYKVSPRDPLTFVSATAVIAVASLASCYLPALRATRIDPANALKCS
jgi:predicted permease